MRRPLFNLPSWLAAGLCLLLVAQPASALKIHCNTQVSGDNAPSVQYDGSGSCNVVAGVWWSGENAHAVTHYHQQASKPRVVPDTLEHEPGQGALPMGLAPSGGAANSVTLEGEFRGAWDFVTGWLSFPYIDEDGEELQVLLRGFFTEQTEANHYSLGAWDGKLFWIDLGDGVPRLLPAQPWNNSYEPDEGELPAQAGRLYRVGYLLYRQAGESYPTDQWVSGAVNAELWFVMDENDEQVLEFSLDLYDDNGDFIESRYLAAGDALQIFTTAYDMADPNIVILIDYMEMKTLSGAPTITRSHWLPNIDYTDSDLAARATAGFDASAIKLELMFEGEWYSDWYDYDSDAYYTDTYYGYSNPPTALGYTWGEAKQIASGVVSSSSSSSSGGGGALWWLLPPLGLGVWRRRVGWLG